MRRRSQPGFTLIEVVVVVAVLAILASVLAPYIVKYVDDSRIAKARNEAQAIGDALTNFYKDVGQWPGRNPATGAAVTSLYTGGTAPDRHVPNMVNFAGVTGWAGASSNLDNNLLVNGASGKLYPSDGDLRWKGPYISGPLPLDPWGRPYVVNVAAVGPIWVISAGPDRKIDTSAADNAVKGDDIGIRVR